MVVVVVVVAVVVVVVGSGVVVVVSQVIQVFPQQSVTGMYEETTYLRD